MNKKELSLIEISNKLCIEHPDWDKEEILKKANELFKNKTK